MDELYKLLETNGLNKFYETLSQNKSHNYIANILTRLNQSNLLNVGNLRLISHHQNIKELDIAIRFLEQEDLLTQSHVNAVTNLLSPLELTHILVTLNNAHLLTEKILKKVTCSPNLHELDCTLRIMSEAELLSNEQLQTTIEWSYATAFHRACMLLSEANILHTDKFTALITHAELFFSETTSELWHRITTEEFTEELFDYMVGIAEEHHNNPDEGSTQLVQHITDFLDTLADNEQALDEFNHINQEQSTHTASIHESISTATQKLWARYQAQLSPSSLEEQLTQIKACISTLPNSGFKQQAALRCLPRLLRIDFIEPISHISLQQLLALIWLAITDTDNIKGACDELHTALINTFYEIQRGYNLDEYGIDDQLKKDVPICSAGAFNKLVEILWGRHPDVQLIYLTPATAAAKFPIIVNQVIVADLHSITPYSDELIKQIKQALAEDTVEELLNEQRIKQISECVLKEFATVYNNDQNAEQLVSLVASAEYVQLNNTTKNILNKILATNNSQPHSNSFFYSGSSPVSDKHTSRPPSP